MLSKEDNYDESTDSAEYISCLEKAKELLNAKSNKEDRKMKILSLLKEVGIDHPESRYKQYPFELSGGMRQRIMIDMCLICEPEVLILDEPTTALDVSTQAKILELLDKIKAKRGLTSLFITHDLGVVAHVADKVAVIYDGKIVEYGSVYDIFYDPRHPYTWALLSSLPELSRSEPLSPIKGQHLMLTPPKGDAFYSRNPYRLKIDKFEMLKFFQISKSHSAATWLLDSLSPDVIAPNIIRKRIFLSIDKYKTLIPESNLKKNSPLLYKPEDRVSNSAVSSRVLLNDEKLFEIKGLKKNFLLKGSSEQLKAVDDISFSIRRGEIFALVGESGSGKSTTGRCINGILTPDSGEIYYHHQKLYLGNENKNLTKNMQMIFQDSFLSFVPRKTIFESIAEGLYIRHLDKDMISQKVLIVCNEVGLSSSLINRYPHELSGGQRQRACIARALVVDPDLLIADEPISSLDISIQAQIINLFFELRKKRNLAILFIAHKLSVVSYFSDIVSVMHKGKIVELAPAEELFSNPRHQYTQAMLSAAPIIDPGEERTRERLKYDVKEEKGTMTLISTNHYVLEEKI